MVIPFEQGSRSRAAKEFGWLGRKRWFLTVDWCNKGNRGIFCNDNGESFGKGAEHTEEEMWQILGTFAMILNPQSIELTKEQLKEYCRFIPLAEYSDKYGVACKTQVLGAVNMERINFVEIDKKGNYSIRLTGGTEPEQQKRVTLMCASEDMYKALKLYQAHQQGTAGHYCSECYAAINNAVVEAEKS